MEDHFPMKSTPSILFLALFMALIGCREKETETFTAQQLVDKAIAVSGGDQYTKSNIYFVFRDREYHFERNKGQQLMRRIFVEDSSLVTDIVDAKGFCRYKKGVQVQVPDSMASAYTNSINSVRYFALLPYGLNDRAVNKQLEGRDTIAGVPYYKVRVTFDADGGGKDHTDVFLYWFHPKTFKPDFLAYLYHTDGGGIRFREAYQERYVNGIRFVDYNNYRPKEGSGTTLEELSQLFQKGKLELLSKIELEDIEVYRLP